MAHQGSVLDLERIEWAEEVRLTTALTNHRRPAWSPDGKWLAFESVGASSREVVVCDRRGRFAGVAAAAASQPAWSPDGRRLAYRHEPAGAAAELWEVDLAAGPVSAHRLVAGGDPRDPAYSPHGRELAYSADEGAGRHLCLLELAGGARRRLSFDRERDDVRPAFSPDGLALAFEARAGGDSQVAVLVVETGVVELLTTGAAHEHSPGFADSRLLVLGRDTQPGHAIVLHDRARRRSRVLTTRRRSYLDPRPFVTAKGKIRLAFCSESADSPSDAEPRYQIATARLDGFRTREHE